MRFRRTYEPGEDPSFTARRELYEETGATDFFLKFLSFYTITKHGKTSGGYLFLLRFISCQSCPIVKSQILVV